MVWVAAGVTVLAPDAELDAPRDLDTALVPVDVWVDEKEAVDVPGLRRRRRRSLSGKKRDKQLSHTLTDT